MVERSPDESGQNAGVDLKQVILLKPSRFSVSGRTGRNLEGLSPK